MQKIATSPYPQTTGTFRPVGQIALNLLALASLARIEARKSGDGHD